MKERGLTRWFYGLTQFITASILLSVSLLMVFPTYAIYLLPAGFALFVLLLIVCLVSFIGFLLSDTPTDI